MTQTFSKTWLLKEYKAHREKVLLDMERARLPESQEDAARYKKALQVLEPIEAQMKPIWEEMKAMPEKAEEERAWKEYMRAYRARRDQNLPTPMNAVVEAERVAREQFEAARTRHGAKKAAMRNRLAVLETPEWRQALSVRTRVGAPPQMRQAGGTGTAQRSHWTFVMRCPLDTCQGFVGTNWKCGLCEAKFCEDCGERVGAEGHACDPDTASTHRAMRKEAKPCPKCAAMISKIDGCDQMWCTQCQTAFSWRTGEIETNHIHNPHYFQWMRTTGAAAAAAAVNRPVGDCLNLTPRELIDQVVMYFNAPTRRHMPDSFNILVWCRVMRHYEWERRQHQHTLDQKREDEWRRVLRVKRLVNEITDDQWKDRLQRGEKAAQKEHTIIQVMDLFLQAGVDFLRDALLETADIPAILTQLEALRTFCNDEMEKIRKRFNCDVPRFTATGLE